MVWFGVNPDADADANAKAGGGKVEVYKVAWHLL